MPSIEPSMIEGLGWIGGALVLAAYALVSIGRLSGRSIACQLMNIAGAAGLTLNGWAHGAVPVAALDAAWCVIGLAALAGIIARRRSAR